MCIYLPLTAESTELNENLMLTDIIVQYELYSERAASLDIIKGSILQEAASLGIN